MFKALVFIVLLQHISPIKADHDLKNKLLVRACEKTIHDTLAFVQVEDNLDNAIFDEIRYDSSLVLRHIYECVKNILHHRSHLHRLRKLCLPKRSIEALMDSMDALRHQIRTFKKFARQVSDDDGGDFYENVQELAAFTRKCKKIALEAAAVKEAYERIVRTAKLCTKVYFEKHCVGEHEREVEHEHNEEDEHEQKHCDSRYV